MLHRLIKLFVVIIIPVLAGCTTGGMKSSTTGWPYDFKAQNAFRTRFPSGMQVPPGMVVIPGGSITVDDVEEFETISRRARPNELNTRKSLSVNSFYMDQREVRNIDWREYQAWLTAVWSNVAPERVEAARPDLAAWQEGLGDNEPFMMNYFSYPAFNEYPVVCISWDQAVAYCAWRSDRVNELRLIRMGVIPAPDFAAIASLPTVEAVEAAIFSSSRYFNSLNENLAATYNGMFPDYRLPSEDEWEFAAYARRNTDPETKISVYPWADNSDVKLSSRQQAQRFAHYNKGNGFGSKVDVFSRTVPTGEYAPNDFGLYNMAGNVNEWVFDQYSTRGNLNRIESSDILDVFLPDYLSSQDVRVYKGGSWKDNIYWLHPASRRYLDRTRGANDVGFRCAMSFMGSSGIK